MWLHFTKAFDYGPIPQQHTEYLPGHVVNVTQDAGAAALKARVAEEIEAPNQEQARAISSNRNMAPAGFEPKPVKAAK